MNTEAYSLDGREFRFSVRAEDAFGIGAFVHLTASAHTYLGQIEALEADSIDGQVSGLGTVLGELGGDQGLHKVRIPGFSHAAMAQADDTTTALVHAGSSTSARVGSLLGAASADARVLTHRFNRHTFWCGQSGSGKTYALGVLLEQLLVHTALPMVILDPNADFVRLSETRRGAADSEAASVLSGRDIRVLRPGTGDGDLHVRFRSLSLRSKAAVLRLDPVIDRAEYNELINIEITEPSREAGAIAGRLRERETPAARALADRIDNLRLEDWRIWAFEHETAADVIDARPDATVLDIGGFSYPEESLVVALSVLDDLWEKRESRRPVLIVIDEAHNLCSPDTDSPLHVAVRDRIIQIAAEGRKFGLWLLLSTQRPSKIHPNILSQCDNLALMRMSSPLDLKELSDVFGFAPPAMVMQSPRFQQGEALFAGGFVAAPTMLKVGERLTVEGGVDVPVPQR